MSLSQASKNNLQPSDMSNLQSDEESGESSSLMEQSSESGTGSQNGNSTDTSRTGTSSDDDPHNLKNVLARRETRQVFLLRLVVILILIAAATSISLAIYHITRHAETVQFELEYYASAEKIINTMQQVMIQMSGVSGLAVAATSDTQDTYTSSGQVVASEAGTWPYVTLSNFQERAGNARTLSGALYVSISPLVNTSQLPVWERYVQSDANSWVAQGLAFQGKLGLNGFVDEAQAKQSWLTNGTVDPLHSFDSSGMASLSVTNGPFLPQWQTSPVLQTSMVNENLFEDLNVAQTARDCIGTESAVVGGFVSAPPGSTSDPNPTTSFFATLLSMWEGKQVDYSGDPMANLFIPIYDRLEGNQRNIVGVLKSTIHWRTHLTNILPKTNHGISVVVENSCDGNFTYLLEGTEVQVVGFGDQHDRAFSDYEIVGKFLADKIDDGTLDGIPFNQVGCPYAFHVYPTQQDLDSHMTKNPMVISLSVAAVFVFTIGMFFSYDHLVERRQRLVLAKAAQSTAIVSSLFPKQVRDRLLAIENDKRKGDAMMAPTHKLKSFLTGAAEGSVENHQPIADFFPNCTVFFGDLAGFTAWSSSREPAQVFLLLQTVYGAFDAIAKRRRVFKVETIGDSYVAVTGLPEPQSHHAVIMAKFAWDCLIRVGEVTKNLEVSLGPDTGELSMRFGLHSGSVTAGVLKGDRARFQLFGDTVNTAARMESTGTKGRIQVSESTAELLRKAGKDNWLTSRDDAVEAKGKGILKTYWLAIKTGIRTASSAATAEEIAETRDVLQPSEVDESNRLNLKQARLVDWMSDILLEHIKKVVIVHKRCGSGSMVNEELYYEPSDGKICFDEIQETIRMPKFNAKVADAALDSRSIDVPYDISKSLREYVGLIAGAYRNNPFHNFEHACHVTMSVNKLLSRIVTPDLRAPENFKNLRKGRDVVAAEIHNFTHGITSDPMGVFAIVFSALIHDVDHQGISNAQLIKEEPEMGNHYRNRSVAEQNSLDVAWDILMSEPFKKLRKYIFETKNEMMRFRQLIVNVVLATDIFDKELGQLRKDRWQRAFHGDGRLSQSLVNDMRATIVMEHIIQASDVSHTMQHWHVYQKWNRKLFEELYQAWKAGRMGANPAEFWYNGELGFFDNYIIPLAKKLRECNVFGVSSDEYLDYAEKNKAEWEAKGEEIVDAMIKDFEVSSRSINRTVPDRASVGDTASMESTSSNTE